MKQKKSYHMAKKVFEFQAVAINGCQEYTTL